MVVRKLLPAVVLLTCVWSGQAASLAAEPRFGPAEITFSGRPAGPLSSSVCGFAVVTRGAGPQVAVTGRPSSFIAGVRGNERVGVSVPCRNTTGRVSVTVEVRLTFGDEAEVELSVGGRRVVERLRRGRSVKLKVDCQAGAELAAIRTATRARGREAGVLWRGLQIQASGRRFDVPTWPAEAKKTAAAPSVLPPLRPPIEQALIEWDWRMQEGIGTPRQAVAYPAAIDLTLLRGDKLIADLHSAGVDLQKERSQWELLRRRRKELAARNELRGDHPDWEDLWRRIHILRRRVALANPLAKRGRLLFVKQVPGCFSHQLTQYYGRYARPGGGVFVLEKPGESFRCRRLAPDALGQGSYQHPELSYKGDRILFSYCRADTRPRDTIRGHAGRYYHLYEMAADGRRVRQLTDGRFDDFSPKYLPNGKIVFVSTRRGGWHRCGNPGCEIYTLALAEADGSNPRSISYHETHEWDPAVLADGRIIYTRWDYVDRHAVYYEQLWTVRTDGSAPTAFYGNNTYNPVGLWEARQVPGSRRVIATAGPHHGMTAGSIVLVDVRRGIDGPKPLQRLTPDTPFPESEAVLLPRWRAVAGDPLRPPGVEAKRWPGHCYRSPFPLSETYFLAAYSFDALVGEPKANRPNMFGIYLVDRFGNKELLYRDLNISSLWPIPLRPRPRESMPAPVEKENARGEGTFLVQNVYKANPALPPVAIKRLRIVQVLPKSTPGINNPPVGLANASPGKQILGTVPVEADGSACFRAPAGVPLAFQVLDDKGQAVQIMRSVTYLRPGETAACVGCHEPRNTAPANRDRLRAVARAVSVIVPGPSGANPLSYPLLVQPVLDKHCVRCHGGAKPKGKTVLTGEPQGHYTRSYNVLARRVPFPAWGRGGGNWRKVNSEPIVRPGHFGARASPLMQKLLKGHSKVKLSAAEIERLAAWMDANALFYGTFDRADQARQRRGERIGGPKLQ